MFRNLQLIIFGAREEQLKVSAHLHPFMLKDHNPGKKSCVVMDSVLNFNIHIKRFTKLTTINLRLYEELKDLEKLVKAFIFNRIVYCNVAFTGLSKKSMKLNMEKRCSFFNEPHI